MKREGCRTIGTFVAGNCYDAWGRRPLLLAGVLELAMGGAHFAMPAWVYRSGAFASLRPAEADFLTLCIVAVGVLLVLFGVLTVFFSWNRGVGNGILSFYIISQSLLWLVRIGLEIVFPVQVPLFLGSSQRAVLLLTFVIEWMLFTCSAVLLARVKNRSDRALTGTSPFPMSPETT